MSPPDFQDRPRKVHLSHNNKGRRNRGGKVVDNTLCASNHGNIGLTLTTDIDKVTCMRCFKLINGRKNMPKPNLKIRVASSEECRLNNLVAELETRNQQNTDNLMAEISRLGEAVLESAEQAAEAHKEAAQLRDKLAVERSDRERATKKMDEERALNNDLRSRLMDSELAYAKLYGYLQGRRDAEPARMIPEQRESFVAAMPDGSGGVSSMRRFEPGGTARSWYHR